MPDSDTITIRDSHNDDVGAIAAIYAHHVLFGTASFETEPPSPDEMHRRRADIVAKGFPHLVAVSADKVVGYAYAGTYRPRAAYRDTVENSVYIRHDQIGAALAPACCRL